MGHYSAGPAQAVTPLLVGDFECRRGTAIDPNDMSTRTTSEILTPPLTKNLVRNSFSLEGARRRAETQVLFVPEEVIRYITVFEYGNSAGSFPIFVHRGDKRKNAEA
jgi:hypothetical protein